MQDVSTLEPRAAQRIIDRIATVGIIITFLASGAFLTLDQLATRAAPASAPVAPVLPAGDGLVRLALPDATWSVISDGTWAAYARVANVTSPEIVLRSLVGEEVRVAYRAMPGAFIGQMSMAGGTLFFEEVVLEDGVPGATTLIAVNAATGEPRIVDRYSRVAPEAQLGGYVSASPRTDGHRVFWVSPRYLPALGLVSEVNQMDLATGARRVVLERAELIVGMEVHANTMAVTVQTFDAPPATLLVDLAGGAASLLDGFAHAFVRDVGPAGVVVIGATDLASPAQAWLIAADGERTRLGEGCYDAVVTERVQALRCGNRVLVTDLTTGTVIARPGGLIGDIVAVDGILLWTEGDELVLLAFPPLAENESTITR